jgi:hypothetical protein
MCRIVQRVWIGQWPNNKTEYLVLRNGQCACIRPADRLKCNKVAQLPEPSQLSQPVSPFPLRRPALDSVC